MTGSTPTKTRSSHDPRLRWRSESCITPQLPGDGEPDGHDGRRVKLSMSVGLPKMASDLHVSWSGRRDSNPRPSPWQGTSVLGCTLATNLLVDGNDVVAVTLTVVGQGKGLRTGGRSRDLYGVIARPSKLGRSSSGVMTPNRMHPPTAPIGRNKWPQATRYRTREFGHASSASVRQEGH